MLLLKLVSKEVVFPAAHKELTNNLSLATEFVMLEHTTIKDYAIINLAPVTSTEQSLPASWLAL